jgi:hypothetical protein
MQEETHTRPTGGHSAAEPQCQIPDSKFKTLATRKACQKSKELRSCITEGTFAGGLFGLLIRKSPGHAAGSKMGSGSRFGKAGAVSLQARGFARSRSLALAPRKLLLSASGQDSCLGSHETILSGCRKGD